MSKKIGKIERKYKRGSGIGSFFLGTFIGILIGIGALVGVGVLAYYKLTPEWINNTFKTDLDLGSEELNKVTLSTIVEKAIYISNNSDKYTLADFEKDFNYTLPTEIKGINIEKLKTKPLNQLGEGLSEVLNDISIDELSEFYTPTGDMEELLDDTLALYVKTGYANGDAVYSDKDCTEVAEFASIENGKVVVKDVCKTPSDGKVEFKLREMPILQGLPAYITHIGDNLTIKRLETKFGITLPSIIKMTEQEKAEKTINQLEDVINDMYIADFLDYEIDGNKVYKNVSGTKTEVTGAVATFAKKKVSELNTLDETISSMKVYEVLDYTFTSGKYYDGGTEITGIMAKLAGYTVGTLSTDIQTLSIADIMDYSYDQTTSSYFVDKNGNGVLDDGEKVTGILKTLASLTVGNMGNKLQTTINNMTIADVLDYTISGDTVTNASGDEVKGVLKTLAGIKVGELSGKLQSKINDMKIADVLDYDYDETTGVVTNASGEPVTGAIATLVKKGTTVAGMAQAVNEFTIAEAVGYNYDETSGKYYQDANKNNTLDEGEQAIGVFALIDMSKKVDQLSEEISSVITGENAKTLSELQIAGLISKDIDLTKKIMGTNIVLGECTVDQLLANIPTE